MADDKPLLRQWKVLRALAAHRYGITVRELSRAASVSEKTTQRDLKALMQLGFPIEELVEEFGRKKWRMKDGANLPTIPFTFDEAAALAMGQRLLEPLADTIFWESAQRAFKKIQAMLGRDALRHVERFAGMFHRANGAKCDYRGKAEMIDAIMVGIEDSVAVKITYQSLSATEPATYVVEPYAFTYYRGALYVVGVRGGETKRRHWKIARMTRAEATGKKFQRPEGFDIGKHLADCFGIYQGDGDGNVEVKVRFASRVAPYVSESQWHPSQRIAKQRDGSVIAEFSLDGIEEVKRWIMGFGPHATVLAPAELRDELVAELQASLRGYGGELPAAERPRRKLRVQS